MTVARAVLHDEIDRVDQPSDLDGEARLLADFAQNRIVQGLAPFEMAARNAPLVPPRLLASADEHDLVLVVPDDRADAEDRAIARRPELILS